MASNENHRPRLTLRSTPTRPAGSRRFALKGNYTRQLEPMVITGNVLRADRRRSPERNSAPAFFGSSSSSSVPFAIRDFAPEPARDSGLSPARSQLQCPHEFLALRDSAGVAAVQQRIEASLLTTECPLAKPRQTEEKFVQFDPAIISYGPITSPISVKHDPNSAARFNPNVTRAGCQGGRPGWRDHHASSSDRSSREERSSQGGWSYHGGRSSRGERGSRGERSSQGDSSFQEERSIQRQRSTRGERSSYEEQASQEANDTQMGQNAGAERGAKMPRSFPEERSSHEEQIVREEGESCLPRKTVTGSLRNILAGLRDSGSDGIESSSTPAIPKNVRFVPPEDQGPNLKKATQADNRLNPEAPAFGKASIMTASFPQDKSDATTPHQGALSRVGTEGDQLLNAVTSAGEARRLLDVSGMRSVHCAGDVRGQSEFCARGSLASKDLLMFDGNAPDHEHSFAILEDETAQRPANVDGRNTDIINPGAGAVTSMTETPSPETYAVSKESKIDEVIAILRSILLEKKENMEPNTMDKLLSSMRELVDAPKVPRMVKQRERIPLSEDSAVTSVESKDEDEKHMWQTKDGARARGELKLNPDAQPFIRSIAQTRPRFPDLDRVTLPSVSQNEPIWIDCGPTTAGKTPILEMDHVVLPVLGSSEPFWVHTGPQTDCMLPDQDALVQASQLQSPLILCPEPADPLLIPKETGEGRIAKALEKTLAERLLAKFMEKYPLTGKAKAAPAAMADPKHATVIQQRLEYLLLEEKERNALATLNNGRKKPRYLKTSTDISKKAEQDVEKRVDLEERKKSAGNEVEVVDGKSDGVDEDGL